MFCSECDYTTPRKSNFNHHLKRHNDIPVAQILPPKIAHREPILNIIEPTENDRFLRDIDAFHTATPIFTTTRQQQRPYTLRI